MSSNIRDFWRRLSALPILTVATLLVVAGATVPNVRADRISDQINALQQENAANRNAVAQLQNQATSYQDAISHLRAQIGQLQSEINNNIAKQVDLQNQIAQAQAELNRQKAILGADIKKMYTDGNISTIELLASSGSITSYFDKAAYREAVQQKIQETLAKITALQNQLKQQKTEVDQLLAEQKTQQAQLSAAYAEQNNLLAYNESQQSSYNQKTQANQTRINALIAEQRRANNNLSGATYFLRFPGNVQPNDPNVDDYPYANGGFGMSTAPGCVDNDGPDRWGYCTRQCVSFAAWAVERSGRAAPRYYGNAKDWVNAAIRDGIPVYTDPQPGDVGISTGGTWGHSFYVQKVSGNQIFVSQYNQQLTGHYSTQWRSF